MFFLPSLCKGLIYHDIERAFAGFASAHLIGGAESLKMAAEVKTYRAEAKSLTAPC